MFKLINSEPSAEFSPQSGLEYWFKERRTLVDFRRGRLGPHFDGFAAYLKAKGYSLDVYFENFRTTGGSYAPRTNARGMLKRLARLKRLAFHFQIDFNITVGCFDGSMAQPGAYHY